MAIVATQTMVTAVMAMISSFMDQPPPFYLQALIIELLAYMIPLAFYAKTNRVLAEDEARQRFHLCRTRGILMLLAAVLGICGQFVMIVLNLPLNLLFPDAVGYVPQSLWELLAAIVVIGIVPAIFEEFLLRGVVYGVMADFNTRAAAIFTTVMFAMLHTSIPGLPGYLFMGAILIILLRRSSSLYACIIYHLANNITALVLARYSGQLFYVPVETLMLFVGGILGFVLCFILLIGLTPKPKSSARLRTGDFLGQSFINLPVLLCIAGIAALLVLQA